MYGTLDRPTVITSGVYEVSLDYPCTLFGNEWKMVSVFQRSINVSLVTKNVDFRINQSITDLFEDHYTVDPLVFDLHEMDAVDRRQIVVRDLLQPLGFQKTPSIRKYLWHLFWLLILAVLGTGGVWGRRHLKRLRSPKSPPNEIEQTPTTASDLRSTASPETEEIATPPVTVFKFGGK